MSRTRKLTDKLKKEIAELVSTGLDVKQALKKLGDPIKANTVYKEYTHDPAFRDLMYTAYFAYVMSKESRLNEIALLTASEAYPNLDFREAEAKLKREVDILKFTVAKVAPILSPAFDKKVHVEHTGQVNQGITLVLDNYYIPSTVTVDHIPSNEQ